MLHHQYTQHRTSLDLLQILWAALAALTPSNLSDSLSSWCFANRNWNCKSCDGLKLLERKKVKYNLDLWEQQKELHPPHCFLFLQSVFQRGLWAEMIYWNLSSGRGSQMVRWRKAQGLLCKYQVVCACVDLVLAKGLWGVHDWPKPAWWVTSRLVV